MKLFSLAFFNQLTTGYDLVRTAIAVFLPNQCPRQLEVGRTPVVKGNHNKGRSFLSSFLSMGYKNPATYKPFIYLKLYGAQSSVLIEHGFMFRIVTGNNREAVFIFVGRFLIQAKTLNGVEQTVEICITKG